MSMASSLRWAKPVVTLGQKTSTCAKHGIPSDPSTHGTRVIPSDPYWIELYKKHRGFVQAVEVPFRLRLPGSPPWFQARERIGPPRPVAAEELGHVRRYHLPLAEERLAWERVLMAF